MRREPKNTGGEREREQSAEKTRRREEEAKKDRSRNDGKANGVEGERGVHEPVGRCVRRADKGERRGVRGRDWEARKQVAGGKQRAEGGGDADERASERAEEQSRAEKRRAEAENVFLELTLVD